MDVLAHGLWGGVGFYGCGRPRYWSAFLIGMAPDLLSFGVFHVSRPGWMLRRLSGEISGPPALDILPPYVFYAYNCTHSLVIFAAVFVATWIWFRRPLWILLPWGLHVLCDIPTHGTDYFPTPFLWPLPTPYIDGLTWATPTFLAANYATIIAAYLGLRVSGARRLQRN